MVGTVIEFDLSNLIHLVNVKNDGFEDVRYLGRQSGVTRGSALANPFKITKERTRKQVIEDYSHWLKKYVILPGVNRTEFVNYVSLHGDPLTAGRNYKAWCELYDLAMNVKNGLPIKLGCWCKPQACHLDVIKSAIIWLIETGRV